MIVHCHKCLEPIELEITNVLRQRIENRIKQLEDSEIDCSDCMTSVGLEIQKELKDLLK
jgi:hypothetical protein